ncbi:MAG: methyltransferase domain-containing protein [Candidatus Dormibacteraeota bacterium]|nr:methyltransferase domain-containing protein [Candidatus Dormibacteraeota bacterium]MBO0762311.1 methyltransferase domain-containing protein [Candidatus Dormibacteraeota bacterium]
MASSEEQKELARARFGPAAGSYVTSTMLAEGGELPRMLELARLTGAERVLDIATGGGHTALAFAPHVREVVATDLTPAMVEAAARHLARQGATNVRCEVADAESLAYAEAEFDVVTARFAPHHFPDPGRFCREVARVLRPGGRFVLFDNMAPEDDELDAFLQRFERWRDPSHVRAHRPSEWRAMLEASGLTVEELGPLERKVYQFDDWTARQGMDPQAKQDLERWLLAAPPACAEFFRITAAGGRVQALEAMFGLLSARRP